ncbi:hypothetical protein TSOC_001223, partial [Tetrabaena socialis]
SLRTEPYAPRHHLAVEVRQQAGALSRLLQAAAAGRLPWAAGGAGAGGAGAGGAGAGQAGAGSKRADPGAAGERRSWMIEKFSAKSQARAFVYSNCRMLGLDGSLLCYCDARKLAWYLGKGLAVQVCDEPPTVQLLFQHQNTDQQMGGCAPAGERKARGGREAGRRWLGDWARDPQAHLVN